VLQPATNNRDAESLATTQAEDAMKVATATSFINEGHPNCKLTHQQFSGLQDKKSIQKPVLSHFAVVRHNLSSMIRQLQSQALLLSDEVNPQLPPYQLLPEF
jgi:hypothetical protein